MDFWKGKPPKNSAIARNYQALQKGSKKEKHDDKAGAIAAEFPKPDKNAVPLDPHQTPFGELVYLRWPLDFSNKKNNSKRDSVVEENLLDVKKLLKASAAAAAEEKKPKAEGEATEEKKAFMQVNVEPYYTHKAPEDNTLIFESRFESGNLASALKMKENENDYLLLLQNDVNTSGHT